MENIIGCMIKKIVPPNLYIPDYVKQNKSFFFIINKIIFINNIEIM